MYNEEELYLLLFLKIDGLIKDLIWDHISSTSYLIKIY